MSQVGMHDPERIQGNDSEATGFGVLAQISAALLLACMIPLALVSVMLIAAVLGSMARFVVPALITMFVAAMWLARRTPKHLLPAARVTRHHRLQRVARVQRRACAARAVTNLRRHACGSSDEASRS
ncbi:MAG TPA: hypothetical protein VIV40_22745 [Kofleriaceae bacterium]